MTTALVEALQGVVGTDDRPVVAATASLSPYSSSFRIEDGSVSFRGGGHQHLVLKDLSWDTMLDGARTIRSESRHDPSREIDVYRHLLVRAPWGPPRMLGAVLDPPSGRHWLFLEKVDGLQLRHVGDFDAWSRAAGWVGRLHARLGTDEGVSAVVSLLPSWTADRFRLALRLASQGVARRGDRPARRAMAMVAGHHETVVERLTAAPPTLVHGQLYPSNVLVAGEPSHRISPLDWETAALGPGVLDLAALVEGDWDEAARDLLCRAYLEGRDAGGGGDELSQLRVDLACARLHLCLEMLALPEAFQPPADHARDWVSRAAELASDLAAA